MSDFGVHRFWGMDPKNGVFEKRVILRTPKIVILVIFEISMSFSQRELVDTIFGHFWGGQK